MSDSLRSLLTVRKVMLEAELLNINLRLKELDESHTKVSHGE